MNSLYEKAESSILDNKGLESGCEKYSTLKEAEARFILRQIVSGLQAIRLQKVMHRDLKPANIFIDNVFIPIFIVLIN